jgi:hypothetical protein
LPALAQGGLMQTSTKVALATVLAGVAVSALLAAAVLLTLDTASDEGPLFTGPAAVASILFLILNPFEFLLAVLWESRISSVLIWSIFVALVPLWWLLVGAGAGWCFRPRASGAGASANAQEQGKRYSTSRRVVLTLAAFFVLTPALVLSATIALMPDKKWAVSCVIPRSGIVSSTLIRTEPNPDTTTGFLSHSENFQIVEETLRVPVRKNIKFGFEYRFPNLPAGAKVRQVIQHPKMVKPDGSVVTGSTREKEPGPYFAYALNYDYEMAPGDWRFEYWYGGKKLCEQTFQLYQE